jgi:hypothetical protein
MFTQQGWIHDLGKCQTKKNEEEKIKTRKCRKTKQPIQISYKDGRNSKMQRLNKIAKKTKQRAVKDKQIDVLNTHTL